METRQRSTRDIAFGGLLIAVLFLGSSMLGRAALADGEYTGEYWNLPEESGEEPAFPVGEPDVTSLDADVNFNWDDGSPSESINSDHFAARWTKTASFDEGTYEFSVRSDDGARVYLDDELILDEWFDQGGGETYTTNVSVSAGDHDIKVEYYENQGGEPRLSFPMGSASRTRLPETERWTTRTSLRTARTCSLSTSILTRRSA